jgi:hypothetical protein
MAEITYFTTTGEQNTLATLNIARQRCQQGDIEAVVIASTFGESAKLADEIYKDSGIKLLIVGEVLDGKHSLDDDSRKFLEDMGHRIIWGMPLGAMSTFTRDQSAALVADAYRRVSEGFKVACEIVLIAASQGYLKTGQKVLSIGGTHRGSDTAVVATAAPFAGFKNFEINEILCKPYQREKE